jgi:hypothetical protein
VDELRAEMKSVTRTLKELVEWAKQREN